MGCDFISQTQELNYTLISIHAPIVGCDSKGQAEMSAFYLFQSTHPSWGATVWTAFINLIMRISIHAPIVGCDFNENDEGIINVDFNPRTHRGVRPIAVFVIMSAIVFQSTHPSWGATRDNGVTVRYKKFQSTHPSWGATIVNNQSVITWTLFQSTHPSWGATQ